MCINTIEHLKVGFTAESSNRWARVISPCKIHILKNFVKNYRTNLGSDQISRLKDEGFLGQDRGFLGTLLKKTAVAENLANLP